MSTRRISQVPNAPVPYPTIRNSEQKRTPFPFRIVYCGVWDRCIVGFVNWDCYSALIPQICQGCWCLHIPSEGGGIPLGEYINSSPPGQYGRHFPDDVLKCIFLNEEMCILIQISSKFVPKGPINNNPALDQIMAWHRSGDKPLSEPMPTQFTNANAALGEDNLCILF